MRLVLALVLASTLCPLGRADDPPAQDLKQKDAELAGVRAALAKKDAELARTAEEVKRLQKELAALTKAYAAKNAALDRQAKEVATLKDRLVLAEIEAASKKEVTNELLRRLVEDRLRERASAKHPAERTTNPPPGDVHAVVQDVDPKSGLVTISIGSDGGLRKGHTLEVFRLEPKPIYLGTIRILTVNPLQAVARPTGTLKSGAIHIGDQVSSNLLDGAD